MLTHDCPPRLCDTTLRSFQTVRDTLLAKITDCAPPFLVGIGGPGGCGKSTLTRWLSLEKAIDIFLHSNLRDYPRFAQGAPEAAHIRLYRNQHNVFRVNFRV
ncbi:MAG: hypothetical protein JJU05_18020 [Verrucomicrobia bacterium]|nr:hypothetical protein [Verrucomicrobiota bacterium]MCH8529084.1 hypothetical protein [Kiritimatiellia bacterium]